jgi:hypothetical protein
MSHNYIVNQTFTREEAVFISKAIKVALNKEKSDKMKSIEESEA